MADITNPQIIAFTDKRVRVAADELVQLFYVSKQIVDQWNALNGAVAIPNDASMIIDGAAADGRPVATGAAVHLVINRLTEFVNEYSANSNAKLNTVIALAGRATLRGLD